MERQPRRLLVTMAAVTGLLVSLGCTAPLASPFARTPIAIDAQPTEWSDVQFVGVGNLTVGIQNDTAHLYLYLSTGDPRLVRRLSRMGLSIWHNQRGSRARDRGFRFWPRFGNPRALAADAAGPAPQPANAVHHPQVESLGRTLPAASVPDVAERFQEGLWVFEVRLPLESIRPGQRLLQLGLDLPTVESSHRGERPGRGRRHFGGGRRFGGGGGGMAGGGWGAGREGGGWGHGASTLGGSGEQDHPASRGPRRPSIHLEMHWLPVRLASRGAP